MDHSGLDDFVVVEKKQEPVLQQKKDQVLEDNKLKLNDLQNKELAKAEQISKQEAKRTKAQKVRNLKVADTQDAATLGKKKTLAFKPKEKREERMAYNAEIDKAMVLTKRATADTLLVRRMVRAAISERDWDIEDGSDYDIGIEKLSYDLKQLDDLSFNTAYIKENFSKLYNMIVRFQKLDAFEIRAKSEKTEARMKADKERLRPLIKAITYRLKVYTEKNRIRLDASVLGENEEGATLLEKDVEEWGKMINAFVEEKNIIPQMDDETRLLMRERKQELGMPQAKSLKRKDDEVAVLTREQAMKTKSDMLSQKSRDQLRDLNTSLYVYGECDDVYKVIDEYVYGSRYSVGYTQERKLLKKAIKAVDEALKVQYEYEGTLKQLIKIKNYFNKMTNGTLDAPNPETLPILEDNQLEEVGNLDGKKRTKLYNGAKYFSNQKDTPLFSHEPVVNDLKQRMVSNCFMMAATAAIINISPDLLKSCLKDNGDGTVTVRIYDKKKDDGGNKVYTPKYYRVRKTIPRVGVGAASMDLLSAGTLWMQMIEKAFAFHGRFKDGQFTKGYRSLWYGKGNEFIEMLLGAPTRQQEPFTDDLDNDVFWHEVCHLQENKMVFSTGTLKGVSGISGLDSGHAYTVLGGEEINGERYIKMRNPYSNHSLQYKSNNKTTHSGGLTPFSNSSDDTYGQFYITYKEFRENFPFIFSTDLYDKVKENTSEKLDDRKRRLPQDLQDRLDERQRKREEMARKLEEERLRRREEAKDKNTKTDDEDDF